MHRIQKLSMIMLIFKPPFSEAFGARKSLRQNTGQRHTILIITAYSYSVIKFSSQLGELGTIFNELQSLSYSLHEVEKHHTAKSIVTCTCPKPTWELVTKHNFYNLSD